MGQDLWTHEPNKSFFSSVGFLRHLSQCKKKKSLTNTVEREVQVFHSGQGGKEWNVLKTTILCLRHLSREQGEPQVEAISCMCCCKEKKESRKEKKEKSRNFHNLPWTLTTNNIWTNTPWPFPLVRMLARVFRLWDCGSEYDHRLKDLLYVERLNVLVVLGKCKC